MLKPQALSRQQLLALGKQTFDKSLSVPKPVRKFLFDNKIWRPKKFRLHKPLGYKNNKKSVINGAKGGLLNCRSANEKELVISELITDNNLSFLILTETWWSDDDSKSLVSRGFITPNGYDLRHAPRQSGTGGGVGLIFRDSYNSRVIKYNSFKTFEYQIIRLRTNTETLFVTAVYLPKGYQSETITELNELLSYLITLNGKLIVAGDFNIHVNKDYDEHALKLLRLFENYNFKQNVSGPTQREGNTLDLVFSHTNISVSNIIFDNSVPSDHKAIVFNLSTTPPGFPKRTILCRKWRSIVHEDLKSDIRESFRNFQPPTVESAVNEYNNKLTSLVDKHAPATKRTVTIRPECPWWTPELGELKRVRRNLQAKYEQSNLAVDYENFKSHRDAYNDTNKLTKQSFYQSKISTAQSPREQSKICNKLLNKEKKVILPVHDTPKELADRFVNFFNDKIQKIRDDLASLPQTSTPSPTSASFSGTPLTEFAPVDLEFIKGIIKGSPNKSCILDPIPASILNKHIDELAPVLLTITNLSLACADFSPSLKLAFVSPLIKKLTLDSEILKNYRPVSNLSFVSKLIEKIVCSQLISHLSKHGLYEQFQSAYREHHSTETALLRVQNDLLVAVDEHGGAILVLLDLSAAFDTIDHSTLLNLLHERFGIQGLALKWVKSYLSDREQCVQINGESSDKVKLSFGVPQGSVLGPILFTIYTTPLGDIVRKHGLTFHLYADDTQIYIAFKPTDVLSSEQAMTRIERCVEEIRSWMRMNFLKLNDDKTELLVITQTINNALNITMSIGGEVVSPDPAEPPRNLGVLFDATMGLRQHTSKLCQSLNYKIYNIGKIRKYINSDCAKTLVNSTVTAKLDYCNSLLYGIKGDYLDNLQKCQNSAARVITRTPKRHHITPVLHGLHWLPVRQRITYKMLLITYKCYNNKGPVYLTELLNKHVPSRTLRSENIKRLDPPTNFERLISYGGRAFIRAAPKLWNELPLSLKESPSVNSFKANLKTHLFKLYYE